MRSLMFAITAAFLSAGTESQIRDADDSGTLIHAYIDDPMTLNPITANSWINSVLEGYVLEALATRNMSNPDVLEPLLAESWKLDIDKLEITVFLRKGVKWHSVTVDGKEIPEKEFTADDVKFTFDVILNPAVQAAHARSYIQGIDKIEKIDKYTIKFKWKEPYFLWEDVTLGNAIIPRHIYAFDKDGQPLSLDISSSEFGEAFNKHWFSDRLIGTGPMKFVAFERNKHVIFKRNENYWGKPYSFSKIIYKKAPDPDSYLHLLLKDEIDFAERLKPMHALKEAVELPEFKTGKLVRAPFNFPAYAYMGWNFQNPIFRDKKVRWALSHAVNLDAIIEKIYQNLATRVTGPFLPGSSANDPSIKPVEYDIKRAKELLEEAGWKNTNGNATLDKVINEKVVEFEFEVISMRGIAETERMLSVIQEDLKTLGISMKINLIDWPIFLERLEKRDFDCCLLSWVLGWKQDPYQIWHSSQADEPQSSNHIAYKNEELSATIDELRKTLDTEKQVQLYHKIHKIIYYDQPYTFLFTRKSFAAYNSRLQNVNWYKIRPCYDDREWWVHSHQIRAE